MKLAVYGEVARDILVDDKGDISSRIGGAGLYASVAVAKQKIEVEFLTVYNKDIYDYITLWNKMGISLKYAKENNNIEIPKYLVTGYKNYEKKVSRPICTLRDSYAPAIPADVQAILIFPIGHNIPITICKQAKEKNLLVLLDPKPNENSIADARMALQYIDILLVNEEEAMLLADTENLDLAIEKLYSLGMRYIIIKRGVKECFIVDNQKNIMKVPAYYSSAVCTLGSGDVFGGIAGITYLKTQDIRKSVEVASCFAARFIESFIIELAFGEKALQNELKVRKKNIYNQDKKINIYLAGPFFSEQEISWINYVKRMLEIRGINVLSPMHENGIIKSDFTEEQQREVFKADIKLLEQANLVVALIDYEDGGTCFEIGYAYKENIPVIGYKTSMNRLNNMLKFGCEKVVYTIEQLVEEIWKYGE